MFTGLIVGAIAFVVVGVFHPLVIAVEFHLGKRMWPAFVLLAVGAFAGSLFAPPLGSMVLGSVTPNDPQSTTMAENPEN